MAVSSLTAAKRLRAILQSAEPKKILVHAGRVKTGSTFLQSALLENVSTLKDQGWIFPESLVHIGDFQSDGRGLRTTGHAIFSRIAAGRNINPEVFAKFEAEMEDVRGKNILFSTENLGRDPREKRLTALAQILDGFDVEIVMYLRRPSDWVNSYYVEQVTGGHEREYRPFADRVADLSLAADAMGFVDQCAAWKTPPTLSFRCYELARQTEGGILADFCGAAGLPMLAEPALKGVNTSPSFGAAKAIRVFNGLTTGLTGTAYKALYADLLKRLAARDPGTKGSFLSEDESITMDEAWAEQNAGIVTGGHISEDDFRGLTEPKPAKPTSLTPEIEVEMLSEVFAVLRNGGVHGFQTSPTVGGVARELGSRVKDAANRRITRAKGRLS